MRLLHTYNSAHSPVHVIVVDDVLSDEDLGVEVDDEVAGGVVGQDPAGGRGLAAVGARRAVDEILQEERLKFRTCFSRNSAPTWAPSSCAYPLRVGENDRTDTCARRAVGGVKAATCSVTYA